MKYRRKSEEVEAWQYKPGKPVPGWLTDCGENEPNVFYIHTGLRYELVYPTWWIVARPRGLRIMTNAAFEEEYEPVEVERLEVEGTVK